MVSIFWHEDRHRNPQPLAVGSQFDETFPPAIPHTQLQLHGADLISIELFLKLSLCNSLIHSLHLPPVLLLEGWKFSREANICMKSSRFVILANLRPMHFTISFSPVKELSFRESSISNSFIKACCSMDRFYDWIWYSLSSHNSFLLSSGRVL